MMRAFWIDRETNTAKVVITDGSLEELYELCHCSCIDITVISVGGHMFNAVVDDEGLLKGKPDVSVFDRNGIPMLVGSVVLFGISKEDGDLVGLKDRQIDAILENTGTALMTDGSMRCVMIADRL